ncbi:MAG: hypothetical protein GXC94_00835 [Comamonadaceae bacterium]|nr:hypothetical protein [Comamonadaceae bacterium]
MNDPTTGREALIAEVIGDVAQLLDRVDDLVPALNAACATLVQACADLQRKATETDGRISALTNAASTLLVKHIVRRADEAAERAGAAQIQALEVASRTLLLNELAPTMKRLEKLASQAGNTSRWWPHAASAVVSSAITCAATLYWLSP